MTISQPPNLQQSTNNLQKSTVPVQQSQFQQQGVMTSNVQGQQSFTPNQQHQVMASNIQAQQQSYNPNQNQQQQQQAPYGVNQSVSNLKAQLDQINQGNQVNQVYQGNPGNQINQGFQGNSGNQVNQLNQPEMGPVGMNGQQLYPHNSNQTVISPGLNNTPLINNKSGNLIAQNAYPQGQGQENIIQQQQQQQPLDLVGGRVPFPSINELPEAIRLSLQGSIKTLLQMNGGVTATTTTTTKSKSPTKTTASATKAKPVSSASPQTNVIKLNPTI